MTLMMKVGMQGQTPQLSDLPTDPKCVVARDKCAFILFARPVARSLRRLFSPPIAENSVWFWRQWVEALCKKDPADRAPMATFVGDMIHVIENGIVEPK